MRCYEGGSVGAPHIEIPEKTNRYKRDANDRIACNRLFCPTCKSWVRHIDRYRIARALTAVEKQALYDSPSPENTGFIGSAAMGHEFRVYFCRCTARSIAGYETVELTDYGWTCGGHQSASSK